MNLYIVEYSYYDDYTHKTIHDSWLLASNTEAEVRKTMETNLDVMRKHGLEPIDYEVRLTNTTDNGYGLIVGSKQNTG